MVLELKVYSFLKFFRPTKIIQLYNYNTNVQGKKMFKNINLNCLVSQIITSQGGVDLVMGGRGGYPIRIHLLIYLKFLSLLFILRNAAIQTKTSTFLMRRYQIVADKNSTDRLKPMWVQQISLLNAIILLRVYPQTIWFQQTVKNVKSVFTFKF